MAAHRVRGAGPHSLLRWHLFPARRSLGTSRLPPHPRRHRRRVEGPLPPERTSSGRHAPSRPPASGRGAPRPPFRKGNPHHLRPGRPRGEAVSRFLRPRARWVRIGAEVPPQPAAHPAPEAPSGGGRRGFARRVPLHAPPDGGRRALRPTRRWVPSLFHGRGVAGPPLREDALRQRAARPGLSPCPPDQLRSPARRRCAPRSRLDEGRNAEPGRGLLLGSRRRLRGRRGAVLHLDVLGSRGSPGGRRRALRRRL